MLTQQEVCWESAKTTLESRRYVLLVPRKLSLAGRVAVVSAIHDNRVSSLLMRMGREKGSEFGRRVQVSRVQPVL